MNIKKVYEALGKKMIVEFEEIHTEIKHMGGRGNQREETLKFFLERYLPQKYSIGSGEIVDSEGNTSKQCDLVLYDKITSPILLDGDYKIFPAESVYAVIEVKSVLNDDQLFEAVENIVSIKNLKRENGKIAGILFAYKTNLRKDVMNKLSEKLRHVNSDLKPHQYIDLLCVLNNGIICLLDENGLMRLTNNLSTRIMMVFVYIPQAILLWFYTNLLNILENQTITIPDLRLYMNLPIVGDVKDITSDDFCTVCFKHPNTKDDV